MVNMKSHKVTRKQVDIIKAALQRYLSYVNEFCMEYVDYFKDMNATNELYKKNPQYFFSDNGIDQNKFFKDYREYQLVPIAEKVLEEVENIHTNIIGVFINPQDDITYPVKTHEWLIDFRKFCFDENGNFLSIDMQNEKLAKYPHFDASTRKPKTYATQYK